MRSSYMLSICQNLFFKIKTEDFKLSAFYLRYKVLLVHDSDVGAHSSKALFGICVMSVRSRQSKQTVALGVVSCHLVFKFGAAGVIYLYPVHVSGEESDVIYIEVLAIWVSLNDKRSRLCEQSEKFGLFHSINFGVLQKPSLVQTLYEKVGALVRAFDS